MANQANKTKSGFVSIVGRTNVGKSTLMNHLIGQKIAITANKPQTTRNRIQTVYTDERGQIIFLDMPGVHKAKNKLGEFMMKEVRETVPEGDVILFVVEPSDFIGINDREIAEKLSGMGKPVILVINKIDTVKNELIPPVIEAYKDLMQFEEIIPVSAKHSINKYELLHAVFKRLPYGEPFYDEETVTDETERNIVAELIREQALRNLSEEVPHGI
ncbi:MAG: GTPase Era, partial [Lachnospiraceae bacterium]|nr:GTPase Era [Lachnospiraceae bacterium]